MKRYNTYLIIAFLIVGSHLGASGQTFTIDSSNIVTCSGNFFDSGGPSGAYGPNENFTTTICPDMPNAAIRLTFSPTAIWAGDEMCFYDGTIVDNGLLLSCHHDFQAGNAFIIQATASNLSGCITITFTSNDDGLENEGWSAKIECVPICQPILSEADSILVRGIQQAINGVDICPGDTVNFFGKGSYPQNNLLYDQADSTSVFSWDFGDGNFSEGKNVQHVYETPGGFFAQLTIQDARGCLNTNFLNIPIRVSPPPRFQIAGDIPSEICVGDTLNLTSFVNGLDNQYEVSVLPDTSVFKGSTVRSDFLALPDGTGASYQAGINFTQFHPGEVLTDVNDIERICVEIEHSWMRDLEIKLTCPNGTQITLHDHPGNVGGQVFLGEPNEMDEGLLDSLGNPIVIPGICYEYCWTPNATNGTWLQYADANLPATLPEDDYSSFDDLSNLIGCPLNGEWTITITDLWQWDNGFICSWGIDFNQSLFADLDSFSSPIDENLFYWVANPTIFNQQTDQITASPPNAGIATYVFVVEDEAGCKADTVISIPVLPQTHPNCFNCPEPDPVLVDENICQGDSTSFSVSALLQDSEPALTFEGYPHYRYGASDFFGIEGSPKDTVIPVSNVNPTTLTDPENQICSVCIDLETELNDGVRIFLHSPSGQTLELSTNNGAGGQNYTQTCFTPTALNPISTGTSPFTGDFQPEGNWQNLTGAFINGDWTISISDDSGQDLTMLLNSWSICFNFQNAISYTWAPDPTLSCTDCPDPVASPMATTTYTVMAEDMFNCTAFDTVTVTVDDSLDAPVIDCSVDNFFEITFNWNSTVGIASYEVSVDNGIWIVPNNGPLSHIVGGLVDGEMVTVRVRGIPEPGNCPTKAGIATCEYSAPCFLAGSVLNMTEPSCFNSGDGGVTITTQNAFGNVSFSIDGGMPQLDSAFTGLSPGSHEVVLVDEGGCEDTLIFDLTAPDTIKVELAATDIDCNGADNGSISSQVFNSAGALDYTWLGPDNFFALTANISGLAAGEYCVSVTDSKGCAATQCDTVSEPQPLSLTASAFPTSCFNSTNGMAVANVTGGTSPYVFQWDDPSGQSTDTAINLPAGMYAVMVQDDHGCEISAVVEVVSPPELIIDDFSVMQVNCFGENSGEIQALVSGGTGSYNFQWNDPQSQITNPAVDLTAGSYSVQVTDENGCLTAGDTVVSEPPALALSLSGEDVKCFGGNDGSAQSQVSGGTEPYSYLWDIGSDQPGLSNLSAGNFVLTVTDNNGCTAERDITITEPSSAVTAQAAQTFQACFGENNNEATVAASGGAGNYSILWSDGQDTETATNLGEQLYMVTVTDDNGCESVDSIQVESYEDIDANLSFVEPTCFEASDGELGINFVTGGSGNGNIANYSFQWSTDPIQTGANITNLSGGMDYEVTITDNAGCTSIETIFLDQPLPVAIQTSVKHLLCFGDKDGQIIVEPSGSNPPFDFSWSPNTGAGNVDTANDLVAGDYSITVTDGNGCTAEDNITLQQPPALSVTFDVVGLDCSGDPTGRITSVASGGTPSYFYAWSTGSSASIIENLPQGLYTLTLTDANGCRLIEDVSVTALDALSAEVTSQAVSCFGKKNGSISIEATGGKLPYAYSLNGSQHNGNPTRIGLEAGTYIVSVKDAEGCEWQTSIEVESPDSLIIDAGPDLEIDLGDSVLLAYEIVNNQGPFTAIWSAPYGGTLSCDSCDFCEETNLACPEPLSKPENTIIYTVLAQDEMGCRAKDMIKVTVLKQKGGFVPTGFTPNDDGVNDLLLVHGKTGATVNVFRVYNRWGELMYEISNFPVNSPDIGWDGSYKGQEMDAGVYVWYLELEYRDGRKESLKGHTNLLR